MRSIHVFAFAALLIAGAIGASGAAQRRDSSRTNVVVFLADDLGWGELGCYGHPRFKTPNIDRLAAEGARMTQFYVPTPYCAPSRAALQTGRYPFRHGLTGNPLPLADPAGNPGADALGLPLQEKTLGDVFRAAGYRTACFGKWHLGHRPEFRPLRRGYEEYLGVLYSNDMHRVELFDGDRMVEYPVVQTTLTRRLTDRAVAFLDRQSRDRRQRPFFLYVPHPMPHKPLAASEEFYNKSGAGLYGDVLAELDASVGRVLTRLRELGLERKTLVIFASDNGPWYGGSTGGLRGMKGQTWEGGIRVPLIARWPGKIPAGRVSHEPAIILDLFPTVLDAAGVSLPKDRVLDGKNLLPVLTGGASRPERFIFAMSGPRVTAVRSGRWKLHAAGPGTGRDREWKPDEPYLDPRAPDGVRILAPFEQYHPSRHPGIRTGDPVRGAALFDLETDPGEQRDVAAEHPDVVERLRGAIATASSPPSPTRW